METQQTHHESRLSEASAERDRLAAHLATALDNCRQLEADFQHSRCVSQYTAIGVQCCSHDL